MQDILSNFLRAGRLEETNVTECGMGEGGMESGVTLKTSSASEMAEILRALAGVENKPAMPPMDAPMDAPMDMPVKMKLPMDGAKEVGADMMPMAQDMERLRGIVDGPKPEGVEEGGMENQMIDLRDALHNFAEEIQKGMHTYDDVVDELNDMFDDVKASNDKALMNAFKTIRTLEPEDFGEGEGGGPNRASIVAQDAMDMIDGEDDSDYDHLEGYDNEPEEEYMGVDDVLPSGDDLHRKKDLKAMRVKDPAVETASIKDRLWAALNEKKQTCNECGKQMLTSQEIKELEELEEGKRHGNSKIYDKCWSGCTKVAGKKRGEPGSCKCD